jgi:hypothetical protein
MFQPWATVIGRYRFPEEVGFGPDLYGAFPVKVLFPRGWGRTPAPVMSTG